MEKILTISNIGLGDFMDEIRKIDIPRIRFTTSHPRDFDDHLIEVLAKGGNLLDISIYQFNLEVPKF